MVTDWKCDFGDGKTSSEQNPSHIYEVVGTFTVSLTTSGPDGADTMIREDYIDINIPTAVSISPTKKPNEFKLYTTYPNPFNPATTIRFALPKAGHVTLKIFDFLGREMASLVDGILAVGEHEVTWRPAVAVPAGIYLYRLQAGEFVETRKLILQK